MSEIAEIIKNINEASKVLGTHITSGEREDHQGSALQSGSRMRATRLRESSTLTCAS